MLEVEASGVKNSLRACFYPMVGKGKGSVLEGQSPYVETKLLFSRGLFVKCFNDEVNVVCSGGVNDHFPGERIKNHTFNDDISLQQTQKTKM